ncbi:hypothetical protein C0J52_27161 [Blattella germanica]|nr:hypothetical protein C0J52_27161 [Blattella germanica]
MRSDDGPLLTAENCSAGNAAEENAQISTEKRKWPSKFHLERGATESPSTSEVIKGTGGPMTKEKSSSARFLLQLFERMYKSGLQNNFKFCLALYSTYGTEDGETCINQILRCISR